VLAGCVNPAVLFDEIRQMGYPGGRSTLTNFVPPLRPTVRPDPGQRYETPLGRQAQCDWAQCGSLEYPDGTVRPRGIFIVTLSYSRGLYIEFVPNTRQDTLFTCREHAFEVFGGGPTEILSDNMTPMVLAPPLDGPVQGHPRFAAFAEFPGVTPKAARPYRGQPKGKGERPVRYVRDNFGPRVPRIASLADRNHQGATGVRTVAAVRIHGTTHERPIDRRAADVAACTAWTGSRRFWDGEEMGRRVHHAGYVRWDGHSGAVGYDWRGQEVIVQRHPAGGIVIRGGIGCFENIRPPRILMPSSGHRGRSPRYPGPGRVRPRVLAAFTAWSPPTWNHAP